MNANLHIDRLSLDLRGIDPALAEAAVRLLGRALQAQMDGTVRDRVVAGRIAAISDPQALAERLAERVFEDIAGPWRRPAFAAARGASELLLPPSRGKVGMGVDRGHGAISPPPQPSPWQGEGARPNPTLHLTPPARKG